MDRLFLVRRRGAQTISGAVNTHAYAGQGFQMDPSDTDTLIPANTTRGFQLRRSVEPEPELGDILVEGLFPHRTIRREEIIGATVSADQVLEAEVEGSKYLTLSGTGDLTGASAGDELGYVDGKLRAKQSGDDLVGWVRATGLTPEESGGVRFLIEFAP